MGPCHRIRSRALAYLGQRRQECPERADGCWAVMQTLFSLRIASTVGRLPRALGVAATNISPAEEQVATDLLDAVEMLRLASFVGGAWKKIVCVVSLLDDDSPTFQKKNGTNKLLKIIDFLRKKDGKHLGVCRAWSRFFSHPTRKI